jgi:ABC-type antimicrobial peptide transport system ATPase subunit
MAKMAGGNDTLRKRAHYAPPWADVSIIGVAGSSGSGKSTVSHAIVQKLNLPWVVILSMVREHSASPYLNTISKFVARIPFTKP